MSEVDLSGELSAPGRSNTRYQILALSGGGYRGLFAAELLARIEGKTPMRERFDLFTGTSIGGIIACALAVGVQAGAVRDAISEHGSSIFPRRKTIQRYLRAPYSADALSAAIVKALGKRNARKQLGEVEAALLLPAISETGADPLLFRSRGLAGKDASTCTLLEAALATAAAPTYFPARRIGNETVIDGGLIANAPDLLGMTEAMRWRGVRSEDVHILSIGTAGSNPAGRPGGAHASGVLRWMIARDLFEITLIAQERLAVSQCATLLGNRYLRLDAQPSAKQQAVLALDSAGGVATATLTLLATQATREMVPEAKARLNEFLENRAG